MAIAADEIEKRLKLAMPEASVEIIDLAGDGDHYRAVIISERFRGKSRVQQHQMIYAILKSEMAGPLHALALETRAPS